MNVGPVCEVKKLVSLLPAPLCSFLPVTSPQLWPLYFPHVTAHSNCLFFSACWRRTYDALPVGEETESKHARRQSMSFDEISWDFVVW
jgi:hypothetical protein